MFFLSKFNYSSLSFNDSTKILFFKLVSFHDLCMCMVILISSLMLFSIFLIWSSNSLSAGFIHLKTLEILWTVVPGLILFFLCMESLGLLYFIEDGLSFINSYKSTKKKSELVVSAPVKVTGKQWYWSYEYSFNNNLNWLDFNYDSYITRSLELYTGGVRKLEVEKPLLMNKYNLIPLKMTSGDTTHSFSMTNFGFKMDAMPGRINSGFMNSLYCGTFYGQCSEMCGANHSFMPIEVEVISKF